MGGRGGGGDGHRPLFMPMPWIASATALKPLGNLVGSGSWLPSAERLNAIQQSSLHDPHHRRGQCSSQCRDGEEGREGARLLT